mgnify:CR=1 FL=1|tara:strand:+ start:5099 stop:5710 length:612 start_codon:yes stop_codon:yes gene_type:complete
MKLAKLSKSGLAAPVGYYERLVSHQSLGQYTFTYGEKKRGYKKSRLKMERWYAQHILTENKIYLNIKMQDTEVQVPSVWLRNYYFGNTPRHSGLQEENIPPLSFTVQERVYIHPWQVTEGLVFFINSGQLRENQFIVSEDLFDDLNDFIKSIRSRQRPRLMKESLLVEFENCVSLFYTPTEKYAPELGYTRLRVNNRGVGGFT